VINRQATDGETTLRLPDNPVIHHFGYAQSAAIVEYKLKVHGHIAEIKPEWFNTVFLDEQRQQDLHPVGSDYWNWETCPVPAFMQDHPYAALEIIR
jgi:hypothetical protein